MQYDNSMRRVQAQLMVAPDTFIGISHRIWNDGRVQQVADQSLDASQGLFVCGVKVKCRENSPIEKLAPWTITLVKRSAPTEGGIRLAASFNLPEKEIDFSQVSNIDLLPPDLLVNWMEATLGQADPKG